MAKSTKQNLEADLLKTAALARLAFPKTELARYVDKAKTVLAYVARLNELDTTATPPQSHASTETFQGRPDTVTPAARADDIVALFPARAHRLVRVPKVIDS